MEQQEVKRPKFYNDLKMVVVFCLLLGLAPFFLNPISGVKSVGWPVVQLGWGPWIGWTYSGMVLRGFY